MSIIVRRNFGTVSAISDENGGSYMPLMSPGSAGIAGSRFGYAIVLGNGTLLWQRDALGKLSVATTAPPAGAGPFNAAGQPAITITVTGLTTAADAVSAAIVVNTSVVTASSRINAQIISYAGTYGTNGVPVVLLGAIVADTSFSFQIANVGTNALSGNITIAFDIVN